MRRETTQMDHKMNEKLYYFYNNGGPMMDI